MFKTYFRTGVALALLMSGAALARADSLTLYCAADEAWCQQIKTTFEAETHRTHGRTDFWEELA